MDIEERNEREESNEPATARTALRTRSLLEVGRARHLSPALGLGRWNLYWVDAEPPCSPCARLRRATLDPRRR